PPNPVARFLTWSPRAVKWLRSPPTWPSASRRSTAGAGLARLSAWFGPILLASRPLGWQPPGMRGDQLMDRVRAPAAGRVRLDRRRGVQQRHRSLPEALDAVRRGEQRVVTAHRVEHQPLVRLQNVAGVVGLSR